MNANVPASDNSEGMHINLGIIFEVFTAVIVKSAIFWDMTTCGFC
jgi:hypothetical protein